MHRNTLFLALLVLVFLCFLYFASRTTFEVIHYSRLSEKKEVQVSSVRVEKVKSNYYQLLINYYFEKEGVLLENAGAFGRYPNHYVAEKEGEKIQNRGFITLWYNPKNLSKTSFEHHFPLKLVVSSVVLLGLSFYLFFLGSYVNRQSGGH